MTRRTAAAATLALATTALTQTALAQTAVAARNAIACPIGYLCLQPTLAPLPTPVLVKEGEQRAFPGGLAVSAVSNRTSLQYCVNARPVRYGLAPGREMVHDHVVLAVGPGQFCPT